jgi:hypothetical protein
VNDWIRHRIPALPIHQEHSMKIRKIIINLPNHDQAELNLPVPLTHELLTALEQSLAQTLTRLRSKLTVDSIDPGLIEYASWLPERRH